MTALAELHAWIEALHVMAVIAWLAALLYLPRLFVYHRREPVGSATSETFKIMEARLAHVIMTPAMLASWLLGATMIAIGGVALLTSAWLLVKLACVVALSGFHGVLESHLRAFRNDRRPRSEGYFRLINEIPTVLMAVIVIMVIVKPW